MNIIEAWKAAKNGDEISNGDKTLSVKKSCYIYLLQVSFFSEVVKGVCDYHLLSDNWEVVKKTEKRKVETTLSELKLEQTNFCFKMAETPLGKIPWDAKVTIEWTE